MAKAFAWTAWGLGTVGAAIAMFLLPWAHYGDLGMGLFRFPGWGFYVCGATLLALLSAAAIIGGNGKWPRIAAAVTGVATAAAAIALASRYDNAGDFFTDIFPTVMPSSGLGGPVAIAAAILSAAAPFLTKKRST